MADLSKDQLAWNNEGIEEHLLQQGIKCKFKPPVAPQFGGVWEQLVRICNKAIKTVFEKRSVIEDVLADTI